MIYFNPTNNTLYDKNKTVLKKLECKFESRLPIETHKEFLLNNRCPMCKIKVIDTSKISESKLVELININSNACLKIDINQTNIIVETYVTLDR